MELAMTEKVKKAYKENQKFKEYVDAFAQGMSKTVSEALECEVVALVYKDYVARNNLN